MFQNTQVTEAWNKIAESFKCTAIEGKMYTNERYMHYYMTEETRHTAVCLFHITFVLGITSWSFFIKHHWPLVRMIIISGPLSSVGMLSHQLKQHVIDGEKTIIQNPSDQQRWSVAMFVVKSGWREHRVVIVPSLANNICLLKHDGKHRIAQ